MNKENLNNAMKDKEKLSKLYQIIGWRDVKINPTHNPGLNPISTENVIRNTLGTTGKNWISTTDQNIECKVTFSEFIIALWFCKLISLF